MALYSRPPSVVFHACNFSTSSQKRVTSDRRSANYQPQIWDYNKIQKLTSKYVGESHVQRVDTLKKNVKTMLCQVNIDPLHQLELIDASQRLGLSYHFEDEIQSALDKIYNDFRNNHIHMQTQESLHTAALMFRILRQHGYNVSQELFNNFRDEKGSFKSNLGGDCKGMLSLYEAAFLSVEGESSIFLDIRNFTTRNLKEYIANNNKDIYLCKLVKQSLDLPLHWRMPRLEARWFIDACTSNPDMNHILLELATLDFNMLQAKHQQELKDATRWWINMDLAKELSFARDRMVANYLWSMGTIPEPEYGYCRGMVAKIITFITTVDDIYDLYGSLDELELFTNAVERWDVDAIDELPHYMKICFLALNSTINEIAFYGFKEQKINIIPYLKKAWTDLCKCYLLEARWYYTNYTPTFQEYIENSRISIGAPLLLLHSYFFTTSTPITKEALDCLLLEHSSIIRSFSTTARLLDDLATSPAESKRGDVAKAVECYMHETGVCEKDAREDIQDLISAEWLKLNKAIAENTTFSDAFVGIGLNCLRTAQLFYQNKDNYVIQDHESKQHVLSLIVNPAPYKLL